MNKPKTYHDYDPRRIDLAESALLTIWGCLGDLHEHLVLVGGLVPKYLCGEATQYEQVDESVCWIIPPSLLHRPPPRYKQ